MLASAFNDPFRLHVTCIFPLRIETPHRFDEVNGDPKLKPNRKQDDPVLLVLIQELQALMLDATTAGNEGRYMNDYRDFSTRDKIVAYWHWLHVPVAERERPAYAALKAMDDRNRELRLNMEYGLAYEQNGWPHIVCSTTRCGSVREVDLCLCSTLGWVGGFYFFCFFFVLKHVGICLHVCVFPVSPPLRTILHPPDSLPKAKSYVWITRMDFGIRF
jgi:hypothetical protein